MAISPVLALLEDPQRSTLIKQGAEAKVYISQAFPSSSLTQLDGALSSDTEASSSVPPSTALFKYRFPKTYRHPSLSSHLTAARTTAEARALLRCAKADVNTPKIICVDEVQGVLGLELIEGNSIRELLGGGSEGDEVEESESGNQMRELRDDQLMDEEASIRAMRLIGVQLAKMHQAHVIHGDLTTSNMMLRKKGQNEVEVVLIDFGLSSNSTWPEDKAVDLYVLERAFQSTHPSSEHLFDEIIDSYKQTLLSSQAPASKGAKASRPAQKLDRGVIPGPTVWTEISRKLDDVRLRGRKRSMVG